MSWEDILKEFTPSAESNEYFKLIELLDYIIENYPDRADNAKSVKKDIDKILDEHYDGSKSMNKKLSDLAQYVTRGKSNTLRDTYTKLSSDLVKRLFD